MKEYTVKIDESQTMSNKAEALEKLINETTAQGWTFEWMTAVASGNRSRIFFLFSRPK